MTGNIKEAPLVAMATILSVSSVVVIVVLAIGLVLVVAISAAIGRRAGHRSLLQRLAALGTRLGMDEAEPDKNVESALSYLEQVTSAATASVAESSADAMRLRRSLDSLPQGVVVCDESGTVVYRNSRANALMTSRHGDALAAQAVTELLEDAWDEGVADRTLDLYGPPRRTLSVRAQLIDDGRRSLGVIAMIEDVSERRRLEEIRRDFVANVSHELKTPMGALGLLAETLVTEPDVVVAQRLASRIHTEAFRVSRIIDDLLDLSRIESEEAPPREPVLVNLFMADAVERVRPSAEQRRIEIELIEPDPPVAVLGDRRQLVSAMHALLENAVTYSYDGAVITASGAVSTEIPGEPQQSSSSTATSSTLPVASTTPMIGDPFADAPLSANKSIEQFEVGGSVPTALGTSARTPFPFESEPDKVPDYSQLPPPPPFYQPSEQLGSINTQLDQQVDPLFDPAPPLVPDARPEVGADGLNGSLSRLEPRDVVRISVADQGVGIPARDLERIFERFYRVDHGRSRATGGTGLGLSIARHVANNHHGWIEVESREGEGSTFSLVVPLQPPRTD